MNLIFLNEDKGTGLVRVINKIDKMGAFSLFDVDQVVEVYPVGYAGMMGVAMFAFIELL